MKIAKKLLIGVGVLLLIIVGLAIALPFFFEDDIKQRIEQEIDASVDADVHFDVDNVNITLFSNFPSVTVQINDVSVVNRAPFEGVPLFSFERLGVDINLYDIFFADQLQLKGITLLRPRIRVEVREDGVANYEIFKSDADTLSSQDEAPSSFSFRIDHWEIIDGEITYRDKSMPLVARVRGLDHNGRGDFNEKAFDLVTHTAADTLSVEVDNIAYITDKKLNADITLLISENYKRFAFGENTVSLNDFALGFKGWFAMQEKAYDMDLSYGTQKNTFKTLLSLVPGIYTERFEDIEAAGSLTLEGTLKGLYNDSRLPAFTLGVEVDDAMFRYPSLPQAVENIELKLHVDNRDGALDNTRIDLQKLHLDVGKNPIDAKLLIKNLHNYDMEASLKAGLDLADINRIFPVEGMTTKGVLTLRGTASGIYDSIRRTMPAVAMNLALREGYVKSSDLPAPLEQVQFNAAINSASQKMSEARAEIKDLSMYLEGEKFNADIAVYNLEDYTWDASLLGTLDIEKLTKIFPLEGMTLGGRIKTTLSSQGKMSDVDQQRYERIRARGEAIVSGFTFAADDQPYAVAVKDAHVVFDPATIALKKMEATVGRSDFYFSGSLTDYMGYLFSEDRVLRGRLDMRSNVLDLNEFMTSSDEENPADTAASYGVLPVPERVDVTFNAAVQKATMMDYTLTDVVGALTVKDQTARLKDLTFNMLGGGFRLAGAYATKDMAKPSYDMGVNIKNLSVQKAFNAFSIVRAYVPVANLAKGQFDADLDMSGKLNSDMTPDLATLNGKGRIKTDQIGIKKSDIVSKIASLTSLSAAKEVTLKDAEMSIDIKNGRLSVDPFKLKIGSYGAMIDGSVGMDGSLDYGLDLDVPTDQLQGALKGILPSGLSSTVSHIPVAVKVGGAYKKPKITLDKERQAKTLSKIASSALKEKGREALQQAIKSKEAQKVINDLLPLPKGQPGDSARQQQSPAERLLEQGLQQLFKKKKD